MLLLGQCVSTGARALAGSEWLVRRTGKLAGEGPQIDLAAEAKLQKLVLDLARAHVLASAHDVSDGGLATTLAECCVTGPENMGAHVDLGAAASPIDALATLFGEGASRIVVSVAAGRADEVITCAPGGQAFRRAVSAKRVAPPSQSPRRPSRHSRSP